MPNGIDWERIAGEKTHPLEKLKPLLMDFSRRNGFKLYASSYHDGLHVEFSKECKSKHNQGYLHKVITMGVVEVGGKLLCNVHVGITTHYGFKELVCLIPFIGRLRNKWPRSKLTQEIGALDFPIDLQRLEFFLNQGKKTLELESA